MIDGYESFTTPEMVREARRLGVGVKVWTVSDKFSNYLWLYAMSDYGCSQMDVL